MKPVQVSVPFTYRVKYLPPKHRNPKEFDCLDRITVAIPSVDNNEAPAALRYNPGWRQEWKSEVPVDHVWWEGKLWRPYSRVASGETDRGMTLDELEKLLREPNEYYSPFSMSRIYKRDFDEGKYRPITELPAGRVVEGEEQRQAIIARAEQEAAGMLLANGQVHVPVQEPIYRIMWREEKWRKPGEARHYLAIQPCTEVTITDDPRSIFRADQLDDAIATMGEYENNNVTTPETANYVPDLIEVLLPEAVRFKFDFERRIDKKIDKLVDEMISHLKSADLPYMHLYIEMRDSAAAPSRDRDAIVKLITNDILPVMHKLGRSDICNDMEGAIKEWNQRARSDAVHDDDIALVSGMATG